MFASSLRVGADVPGTMLHCRNTYGELKHEFPQRRKSCRGQMGEHGNVTIYAVFVPGLAIGGY